MCYILIKFGEKDGFKGRRAILGVNPLTTRPLRPFLTELIPTVTALINPSITRPVEKVPSDFGSSKRAPKLSKYLKFLDFS